MQLLTGNPVISTGQRCFDAPSAVPHVGGLLLWISTSVNAEGRGLLSGELRCKQFAQGVRKRLDPGAWIDPNGASERRHDATLAIPENVDARREMLCREDPLHSGRLPEEDVCLISAARLEGEAFLQIRGPVR